MLVFVQKQQSEQNNTPLLIFTKPDEPVRDHARTQRARDVETIDTRLLEFRGNIPII